MNRPHARAVCCALLAIALTACETTPAEPVVAGVVVATDAREYAVSTPPHAAFATIENRTYGAVTVRRCLLGNSVVNPVGMDLVVEREQSDGSWQPVDLGFDCATAGAPRADVVLAPFEVALVLRLVVPTPARYRLRVAYGPGEAAAPTDTAVSAVFAFR